MTTPPAFAYVLVDSPNDSTLGTLVTKGSLNVESVSATADQGIYRVVFSDVFADYPVVTVTQYYNGTVGGTGHELNSVVSDVGFGDGYLSDNAVVVFVAKYTQGSSYYCDVKLGNGNGGLWRSFGLTAIGPAATN